MWTTNSKKLSLHSNQIHLLKYKIKNKIQIFDNEFDSLYPETIQNLSRIQWTPSEVIYKIYAEGFITENDRVLDIGSGVGKFCILMALLSKANYFGIEKRKNLCMIANRIANDFSLSNVKFQVGEMTEISWLPFNVFYFYNPFYESITNKNSIDSEHEKGLKKFTFDLVYVKNRLSEMPKNTKVITYHTFGGKMPKSYDLTKKITLPNGDIELFTKII